MAYIGKEPANSFISFAKQDFTTSATTSYTLDNAVTNENELALFINFVRQEPTTAYTASGTTLTLTSATASTDDMYCVYLGQAKQTVNAPDGSVGSSQVAASIITGQTAETSIATDDTVLIHDTSAGALRKMTRANFVSGIGGTNTPAFEAYTATSVGVSNNAWSKATFGTERYDTGSAFASSTFSVPSGQAGKYHFYTACRAGNDGANTLDLFQVAFDKNGSLYANNGTPAIIFNASSATINNFGASLSQTMDLSVSDYVEVFVFVRTSVASPDLINDSFFGGYKIIE